MKLSDPIEYGARRSGTNRVSERSRPARTSAVSLAAACLLLPSIHSLAQVQPVATPVDAQRHQEQRLNVTREQAVVGQNVLTPAEATVPSRLELPAETPCFRIAQVEWRDARDFPWLPSHTAIEGQCVGAQGLNAIRTWLTRELIARGYITTQVIIPEQDISSGHLIVQIIPGRIGKIVDDSTESAQTVFPGRSGDLLNVRDLDQALENVRRLSRQTMTAFDLTPGARPGEADIIVKHPSNASRARVILTADNSGIDATGRYQLGGILTVDSPLHLYDQLIATYTNDAQPGKHTLGSSSKSIAWNIPIGYASLSLGYSEWQSRQSVSIGDTQVPYTGRTRLFEIGAGYVPYRSSHSKGSLNFRLFRRQDREALGGMELATRTHDITGYEFDVSHLEKLAHASLNGGVGVRGSVAGISQTPGYVYGRSHWSGQYQILLANASVVSQFAVGSRNFGYNGSISLQHAIAPIPSTEYLQIGGRYTVRGFDGNSTLTGSSGWVWRNEIATQVTDSGSAEGYVAFDAGGVFGVGASNGERTLVGTSLGVRGSYRRFGYDVSIARPIAKPSALKTGSPSVNFLFTSQF